MYICPMDRDFQWIRKVIGSITHFGQIQSAENLIDLYVKKYQDSEELIKYLALAICLELPKKTLNT